MTEEKKCPFLSSISSSSKLTCPVISEDIGINLKAFTPDFLLVMDKTIRKSGVVSVWFCNECNKTCQNGLDGEHVKCYSCGLTYCKKCLAKNVDDKKIKCSDCTHLDNLFK